MLASRDIYYPKLSYDASSVCGRSLRMTRVVDIAVARAAAVKAAQQRPDNRQTVEEILSGLPPFDGDAA